MAYNKEYYQKNKDKWKNHYQQNKEEILDKSNTYYQNNKEKRKEYLSIPEIQEKRKIQLKEWRNNNPEYMKDWKEKNRERWNELDRVGKKKKRENDPLYKIKDSIASSIYNGLQKYNKIKSKSTKEIIGLESWDLLREHIEKQWEDGMSWDNYGVGSNNSTWHIDHIVPISSAQTEDNIYTLNHYTNLRPMWCSDNIRKSNKI